MVGSELAGGCKECGGFGDFTGLEVVGDGFGKLGFGGCVVGGCWLRFVWKVEVEKLALLELGDAVFDDGGDGFVMGVFGVVVGWFG